MPIPKTISFRKTLLSSGELTTEAIISAGDIEVYESSPAGLTVGLKEKDRGTEENIRNIVIEGAQSLSQKEFDQTISSVYGTAVGTALSLAYARYLSKVERFSSKELYKYFAEAASKNAKHPKLILNVLNGGTHANSRLAFCEFMIIPRGESVSKNVQIASEVYLDLREILASKFGETGCLVGREGGFAPAIDNVGEALTLISDAIRKRHKGEVSIAIDVAANSFSERTASGFRYRLNGKSHTSAGLLLYYTEMVASFPEIIYIEDGFHEEDIEGWRAFMQKMGNRLLIVADDLTVSNRIHMKKYLGCFNACILKINQVGDLTTLLSAYEYCQENAIVTIISQRSGETDSNILAHLAVGWGSDYIKAGAPARERVVKYNELIRIKV